MALPIVVSDFSVDPSGPEFTIAAIGPTAGLSNNLAVTPSLSYAVNDTGTGTLNTMQMNWQPAVGSEPAQAGWELVFGTDPDLTNQTITLSINPPGRQQGPNKRAFISHLEIIIRDINGNSAGGWGFNTDQMGLTGLVLANDPGAAGQAPVNPAAPPVGVVASLANNFMQTVTINVGAGPAAGSATITGGPGGPFIGPNYLLAPTPVTPGNIAQAASLEFYENGVLQGTTTVPTYGGAGLNNYWDHITVTPEPASLALLALGGLAVLRRRR